MKTGQGSLAGDTHDFNSNAAEPTQAQDHFDKIFHANPAANILTRMRDGLILDVNDAFLRTMGYSREELVGRTTIELGMWSNLEERRQDLSSLMGNEPRRNIEITMRKKSGEPVIVSLSFEIIELDGEPCMLSMFHDVTEHRVADDALRLSQQKYRELVEQLPQVIYEMDTKGNITFANKSTLEMMGYKRDEIENGFQVLTALTPEDRERAANNIQRILRGEAVGRNEYTIIRKDGSTFPAMIQSSRIMENGQVVGLRGMIVDITDRKRFEQALRESELQYRQTLNNMGDSIHVVDRNLTIILANDTMVEWNRELELETDVAGKRLVEVYPFLEERVFDEYRQVFQSGETLITEEVNEVCGQKIITKTRKIPVFDGSEVNRIVTVISDITERKRAEEEINESNERYRHLFERNLAGVYRTTLDGQILDCNDSFARILGFNSRDEALASNARNFYGDPADREKFIRTLQDKGILTNLELRLNRREGDDIWVLENVNLITADSDGSTFLEGTLIDITERKRAEAELRESEDRFRMLVENQGEGIGIVDLDDTFLFANAAAETLFGLPRGGLIGKNLQDLTDPEDYKIIRQHTMDRLNGICSSYEHKIRRADGELRTIIVTATPLYDTSGAVKNILDVFRDVTEQKTSEQSLIQSLSLLQATLESTTDGILVVDAAGKISGYNRQFVEMWNIPQDVIASKDDKKALECVLDQLIDPGVFLGRVRDLYDNPEVSSFDTLEFKDGKIFERYSQPQRINGEANGRVWSFRDVTDRMKSEQILLQVSNRQNAILASVPDIIAEVDVKKVYTWLNKAGLDFFGDDAIGKSASLYFEGEQDTFEVVRPLFDGCDEIIYLESWQRRKDGVKRLLAWWCRVLKNEAGEVSGALSTARDITDLKRKELEQSVLHRISAAIATISNLDDLMKTIHENVKKVMYAENCYIALYDAKSETVSFPFFVDQHDETPAPRARRRGFTEYVLRTGQPLLLTPQKLDELISNGDVELIGTPPQAYLAVPLFIHTKSIGVLVIQSYEEGHKYSSSERELLAAIGHLAAYTIERQVSQDDLKKSEEKYRTLVNNIQDGVCLLQDGSIRFVNEAFSRIFGYSEAESSKLSPMDMVAPEDQDRIKDYYGRRQAGENAPHEYEFIALHRDKTTRIQIHLSVNHVTFEGKPAFMYTLRDVTERHMREKEREAILNINKMLLGELDTERALRSLGEELKELVPHNILALSLIKREQDQVEFIMASDSDPSFLDGMSEGSRDYSESYQGSLTQQIIFDRRNRIQADIPENGAKFETNLRTLGMRSYIAVPLVNVGVPLGMLFIISERPQAFNQRHEQLLHQIQPQLSLFIQHQRLIERVLDSEAKYRKLFENSHDIIYILQDKRFVYVNPRFEELLEYKLEEVSRSDFNFMKLVAPESVPLIEERTRRVAAGEKMPPNYEFKTISKSGKVLDVDVSVSYITYEGRHAVQGILRDISERKRLEARQKEMQLELMQTAKLSSIGMLAAGIAHNLNVPLQGLINHIELLKLTRDDLPNVEDMLNQAQRISAIINNMLYKSRQEQDQTVREINLNQLLVEELNFLNADLVFKHRIHKEYKFDPSLPIVRGVYSDFSQALLNIIKNALDAMYDVPNKRLSVKTETASAGDVLIQVGDSGCGIPEEHLPQIFDPFFTTKPASVNRDEAQPTGTGLGLSSAYQLLKKYNARIEVDSKIGQGTTFNIYIPASATKIEMDVSSLLAEHQAELVEV